LHFVKATVRTTRPGRSLFLPSGFRRFFLPKFLFFALATLVLVSVSATSSYAQAIKLETDQAISSAGYYQLSWDFTEAPTGTVFIVDERTAEMSLATPIYSGKDTAMVISGKPDGTYIYQVRSADNQYQSNAIEVVVSHHSLATAFRFFVLGAIVFIVLLIVILRGNKVTRNE
jgi:hypothetical protein